MNLPENNFNAISKENLLTGKIPEDTSLPVLSESVTQDISILFGENNTNDVVLSKDLQYSVRLLPALILELARTSAIVKEYERSSPELVLDEEARVNLVDIYKENKGDIFKGLALILGFDLIEGNGLDLFGFLGQYKSASATQVAASTAGAAGASNAVGATSSAVTAGLQINWIAAGIVVAASIVYFRNQIVKAINRDAKNMNHLIDIIQDRVVTNIQMRYRELMANYETLIRERLMRKFKLHENIASISNCNLAVRNLEISIRDFERDIRKKI